MVLGRYGRRLFLGVVILPLCGAEVKGIYIAGPYRGRTEWDIELNIMTARLWAEEIMRKGWATYTPHVETAHSGLSFDDIMARDLFMLEKMEAICMLPGWERSEGARMEYSKAVELGMKVYQSPMEVPYESD